MECQQAHLDQGGCVLLINQLPAIPAISRLYTVIRQVRLQLVLTAVTFLSSADVRMTSSPAVAPVQPRFCLTRVPLVQAASQGGSVTAQQARRMDGAFLAVGALNDILKRKVLLKEGIAHLRGHPPIPDPGLPACVCLPAATDSLHVSGATLSASVPLPS